MFRIFVLGAGAFAGKSPHLVTRHLIGMPAKVVLERFFASVVGETDCDHMYRHKGGEPRIVIELPEALRNSDRESEARETIVSNLRSGIIGAAVAVEFRTLNEKL